MKNTIKPGKTWLDTEGKRIQAHGGSVICVDQKFYWYGENKEKTMGADELWHWGVRCYSSDDLCEWKDEGVIIPPDLDDPTFPLHPNSMMDRPHIIYNEKTKKYVAWLKIMNDPSGFAVLTADHILGPYEMVDPHVNPFGQLVGDFDLYVDEKTGKGYVISEKPHTAVYCADLNEEYTAAQGTYSEHFPHEAPPISREAPAHFVRNGKHYLITSGTTGYFSNPSEAAVADELHGPYKVLGNPHPSDTSKTSFNSQISSVFKHPYKDDLYIAIADRWRPEIPETAGEDYWNGKYSDRIQEKFKRIFDPEIEFVFTEEDAKDMRINSSMSDYVWLPLQFEGDKVIIEWLDEWSVEDYK
ncbi:hypothetical protein PMF13cell1_01011 [Blautia producta]|uniref:Family 43 glycosylhydrolase n=1 Tax=Blautia producta TaxID=33035 RepID=A0A4P6LWB3_9FIRM|nr:family 43 glycosylhydrolase [Blautia producta]QBE95490.1 hypothetical protein PMF13cell1_01011 [Blautia producta]